MLRRNALSRARASASRLVTRVLRGEAFEMRVARSLASAPGDGCIVRARPDGTVLRASAAAHRVQKADNHLRLLLQTPALLADAFSVKASQTSDPVLLTRIDAEYIRLWTSSPLGTFLVASGAHSVIAAPLFPLALRGAVTLWRDATDVPYTEDDLMYVEEFLRRAAAAVRGHA